MCELDDLIGEMAAYVRACRRNGDRRDAWTIVATAGIWSAREIIQALQLSR
jgi:hypothetical protein